MKIDEPKYKVGDIVWRNDKGDQEVVDRRLKVVFIFDDEKVNRNPQGQLFFALFSKLYHADPTKPAYGCEWVSPDAPEATSASPMIFFEHELEEV